jgi:hypothetical protein
VLGSDTEATKSVSSKVDSTPSALWQVAEPKKLTLKFPKQLNKRLP